MALTIQQRPHQDLAVVVLTGEVDVAASAQLRESLAQLVASGTRHLILDLHAVTFIDSNGLSVLLSIHHHLRGHHGSLVLAAVNQRIRHVLRITQLTRIFPIYGTPDVAFHAHLATRTPDTRTAARNGEPHRTAPRPAPASDHDHQAD